MSDTDRINRAVGLPPVQYAVPSDGQLVRRAKAKFLGLAPVSWDEFPFEWIEPDFYAVRRVFHGSPIREIRVGTHLASSGHGSRIEIHVDVEPRNILGRLLGRTMFGGKSLADLKELYLRTERPAQDEAEPVFERRSGRSPADRERLQAMLRDLSASADPRALARLVRHLTDAYDEEVVRMRPFALADRWGLDRVLVLAAFLHAARYGALDAHWDILCPNCRVAKASYGRLSQMRGSPHCDVCRIDISKDFERNVELRFTVHPDIRRTLDLVFCVGGPRNTPHRLAQLLVPPEGRTVSMELPDRRLILRTLAGRIRRTLTPDAPGGASRFGVRLGSDKDASETTFRPGRVELRLEADSSEPTWIAIEEEAWTDQAATAAAVTALQDFRDLFSSDALSPGEEVELRNLAVLFTDIKGSTALYERVGDAKAYGLVRDHFGVLTAAVRECHGAVVKTIGDAVMAVFASGEDAAESAFHIQERFAEFNRNRPVGSEAVIVKVGVHRGPALMISAGGVLDYFGTTVNTAARVQSESEGGDVVMSTSMIECARTAAGRRPVREEHFDIALKGLSGTFRLWRLRFPE